MEFLRNTWYVALWAQDLAPSAIVGRIFLDEPIVLFRQADGTIGALEDMCPHRFAPLRLGKLTRGHAIQCGYHGLEFDHSGACILNPHGNGHIPPALRVRSYPVAEKHTLIWIWMGDRAADPATIPDFSFLDGNDQVSRRDWLLMNANYELIIDNLLDLSHTAFLHDGILGNEETIKAEAEFRETENSLFVGRAMSNVKIPGFFDLMFRRDGRRVDSWADMNWHQPGCMINSTGVTLPGASRSEGTGIYGLHFLTPETATSTYYHFAGVRWNPVKWGEPIDREIMEQIAAVRRHAFEFQDKIVIEAQQQAMTRGKNRALRPVLLDTDRGPVRYRRILERLIARDRVRDAAE